MEKTKRIDYKALCEAPFNMDSAYEVNFRMLVYTGRKEGRGTADVPGGDRQGRVQGAYRGGWQGVLGHHRVGSGDGRESVVQLQRLCQPGGLGGA